MIWHIVAAAANRRINDERLTINYHYVDGAMHELRAADGKLLMGRYGQGRTVHHVEGQSHWRRVINHGLAHGQLQLAWQAIDHDGVAQCRGEGLCVFVAGELRIAHYLEAT